MALRELYIDGYGHFQGYPLKDLGSGLTVLHGPNEAGKTTLTAFLLYLLFGPVRGDRPAALAGGRPGGRLRLDGAGGELLVERFEGGTVTVRHADGAVAAGDEALRAALGGLDRALYRAVYSFSLDDLRSFDRLGEAELRDRLFTGSLAGAGRSVSSSVAVLQRRQTALWRPRAKSRLGELQDRRATLEAQLLQAQRRAGDLRRLVADLEEVEAEHTAAIEDAAAAELRARRARARVDARIPHAELRRAEARLADVPEGAAVGAAHLDEARRVALEHTTVGASLAQARRERDARAQEHAALPPVSGLSQHAERVRSLAQQAGDRGPSAAAGRVRRLQEARERLAQALAEAGWPDAARLAAADLSTAREAVLRALAGQAVAQASREDALRRLEAERASLAQEVATAEAEVAALPRDVVALEATVRVEALRRDEAATAAARDQGERLAARSLAAEDEIRALEAELGAAADGASADLQARGQLAADHRSWRQRHAEDTALHAQSEALVRQRAAALDLAEAALRALGAEEAPPASHPAVVDGFERFVLADTQRRQAQQAQREADEGVRQALEALGSGWSREALSKAAVDAAARERLRSAARAVEEAQGAAGLAAARVEAARAELEAAGVDPAGAVRSVQELDALGDLVEEADAAVRARAEAAARAQAPRSGVPGWARWAGLGIGALIVLLGVSAAAAGAWLPGVAVAILGLGVMAGSWWWLVAPAAGAVPEIAPDHGAGALLVRLGLPPTAGAADLVRRRQEVARERRAADLHLGLRRALDDRERRVGEVTRGREALAAALRAAGWPEDVRPESFAAILADVLRGRALLDDGARAAKLTQEADGVLSAWRRLAASAAEALRRPAPHDLAGARALVDALRAAERDRLDAARRRDEATAALRRARADVEDADRQRAAAAEAVGEVAARAPVLRARAAALGVPDAVDLEVAPDWLARADRLRALRQDLRERCEQRDVQQRVVAAWEARLRDVVTAELGASGPDALAQAEARCRRAATLEADFAGADARRRRLAERLREHDDRLRAVQAETRTHAGAATRWAEEASAAGLPEGVAPEVLDAFLSATQRARRAADDVARRVEEDRAAEQEEAAWVAAVGEAVGCLGADAPRSVDDARALVERAVATLTEDRGRQEALARAERHLRNAEDEVDEQQRRHADAAARLAALLDARGVASVDDLERLHAEHEAHAVAVEAVRSARRARELALGEFAADPDALAALDAPDEAAWAVEAERANTDVADARARVEAAIERRTQLRDELDRARGSKEVADLEVELASVRVEVDEARRELAVLVLAQALLERTLQRFREAHQPQILRRAGAFFGTVTRGVYTGIEPDLDGKTLFLVDQEGGRRRAEDLSRGTAELLYLVLRLGLARDLASGGVALPLVLDDVLVNLDPERSEAMADLLREVVREQQVLLLTCRPETRDLLSARIPGARVVELPRFAGRALPVARPIAAVGGGSDGLSVAAQQLYDALSALSDPIGRAQLLELTNVPSGSWNAAIAQLKDLGLVVQEGQRKGARYRLA